jgi:hypothetical protein
MGRLEVGTECGSHRDRRQQGVYVAMSQVPRVTTADQLVMFCLG